MTVLRERIETTLPLDDAFAFVADFANAERWDPGVATLRAHRRRARSASARAIAWASACAGGSSPMDYEVTAFEPPTASS